MPSDRPRFNIASPLRKIARNSVLAMMTTMATIPVALAAEPWKDINCSDAGYAGRRAFTCGGFAGARDAATGIDAYMSIGAWANPEMHVRADFSIYKTAIRRDPAGKLPADPVILKADGRTVRQFAAADLADVSIDEDSFTAVLALSEAQVNELASAQEITVEATSQSGEPVVARFPGRNTLGELTAKARSGYQSYHVEKRKLPRKANDLSIGELWGPLGEAADRSEFWIEHVSYGVHILELKWVEQDKVLRLRHTECVNRTGSCDAGPQWTAQVNPNAAIEGATTTVLDFYNESGKPVLRAKGPGEKGRITEGTYFALEFDPVLKSDMGRSSGGKSTVGVLWQQAASGLGYGVGRYSPATLTQVEQAIGKIAGEKRARERAAREEQEAANRAAAEREAAAAIAAAEEEEEDRERQRARPNLAQVFAGTFASEMAKSNAQRAQAQAGINAALAQGSRQATTRSTGPSPSPSPITTTRSEQQVVSPQATSWSRMSDGPSSPAPQKQATPGKPLKFVLTQSMEPGLKAKNNPTCVSNVITVQGPAGFGSEDWGEQKAGNTKAREIIESYFSEFTRKCQQTIDGSVRAAMRSRPSYEFNMSASEEQKPQQIYDRLRSVADNAFVSMR